MRRPGESQTKPDEPAKGPGQELVTQFVAGERDAFAQVFQLTRREVLFVVQRFFRSPFDQEEAFQEAWLQIYRMRQRFDVNRHAEFLPWARQVARYRCIDLIKARTRRPEVPVEEIELPQEASQLATAARSQLRQRLEAFVDKLDRQQREFFALCFAEELPHEEIARQMSISVRRCKYLKKKLLERMLRSPELRKARAST